MAHPKMDMRGWRSQIVDPWSQIRMEDEDGDGTPPANTSFTQDQVNEIAAREKRDGRRSAERELVDELGMTPTEAKAIIDAHKQRETDEQSEVDRARAEKSEAETKAERAERVAAEAKLESRLVKALARAGAQEGVFDDALVILQHRLSDDDPDDDAVKTVVKKMKTDMPTFFAKKSDEEDSNKGSKPKPPSGDPGSPPPSPGTGSSIYRGRERAQARLGKSK